MFERRRYFNQPYPHRWVVRHDQHIIAQLGVHERLVTGQGRRYDIGGVGDVCVHPNHRGRGLVKQMLTAAHAWLADHEYPFALLFGNPQIYQSSGYVKTTNVVCNMAEESNEPGDWRPLQPLVCELGDTPWPQGQVHLPGPTF